MGKTCRVAHGRHLTEALRARTGVTQGCQLSPFLFLRGKDWARTSAAQRRSGIQWTPRSRLDECDLAVDLTLLSHTPPTTIAGEDHYQSNSLRKPWPSQQDEGQALEAVETFTFLGSVVDKLAGTDADVRFGLEKQVRFFTS